MTLYPIVPLLVRTARLQQGSKYYKISINVAMPMVFRLHLMQSESAMVSQCIQHRRVVTCSSKSFGYSCLRPINITLPPIVLTTPTEHNCGNFSMILIANSIGLPWQILTTFWPVQCSLKKPLLCTCRPTCTWRPTCRR